MDFFLSFSLFPVTLGGYPLGIMGRKVKNNVVKLFFPKCSVVSLAHTRCKQISGGFYELEIKGLRRRDKC
jgi:hypothetical protein